MHTTPLPRIRVLPTHLVNQIAAGEVVERPASVLKELLENSLDAGATTIRVGLQLGGLKEIDVTDNGSGIPPDDLPLALHPHATSKLSEASDLERILTFGFRGEALASIASVARVEIHSRPRDFEQGIKITTAFGAFVEGPAPTALAPGTKIRVTDLFAEVPARLKFLRSEATEYSHCSRLLKELSLAHPAVRFELLHNGRTVLTLVPGDRLSRFREIFAPAWTPVEILEESAEVLLHALLSPPTSTEDRGDLHVFVNRRLVRQRLLHSAVKRAYQEVLGLAKTPSGVLFLEIKPESVDVNVHPQKWEIRLLAQERLFSWILSALRKGLATQTVSHAPIRLEPLPEPVELPLFRQGEPAATAATWESSFRPAARVDFAPPLRVQEKNLPAWPTSGSAPTGSTAPLTKHLAYSQRGHVIAEDALGLWVVDPALLVFAVAKRSLLSALSERKAVRTAAPLAPLLCELEAEHALEKLHAEQTASLTLCGVELQAFGNKSVRIAALPLGIAPERARLHITHLLKRAAWSPANLVDALATATVESMSDGLSPLEVQKLWNDLGPDTSGLPALAAPAPASEENARQWLCQRLKWQ